jgi:hypothetical protein
MQLLDLPNRYGAVRALQDPFHQAALGVARAVRKLWHAEETVRSNPNSENRIWLRAHLDRPTADLRNVFAVWRPYGAAPRS